MCINNISRSKRKKCPDPTCNYISTTIKHNCPTCNRVLVDARGTISGISKPMTKDYVFPNRVPWPWEPESEEYEKNKGSGKATKNAYT